MDDEKGSGDHSGKFPVRPIKLMAGEQSASTLRFGLLDSRSIE
jgi:hypothetical protein